MHHPFATKFSVQWFTASESSVHLCYLNKYFWKFCVQPKYPELTCSLKVKVDVLTFQMSTEIVRVNLCISGYLHGSNIAKDARFL